jgi:diguanylate cyclase (GGDEF)-like protein
VIGPGDGNGSGAPKDAEEEGRKTNAEVARLKSDVLVAEGRLARTNDALREANEQLLLSSLRAHTDVEACKKALRDASRVSEHDELTALPNRALLRDRFEQAILHAKRDDKSLALLFLDLDNFKEINDTLGHAVGDQVLKDAAHCLVSTIRAGDTVSRHGGDEFVILLDGVSKGADAAIVAEKVAAALGVSGPSGEDVPRLTASIGISVYPGDGDDVDTLIERADAAMYLAKKHGPGGFAFHSQEPPSEPRKSFMAPRRQR